MTARASFFWGVFGAVLPEILRLWKLANGGQHLPDFSTAYFVLLPLFVISGGFFSIAWKPENPFKAIWVGISLPVLVATLAQSPPPLPH